MSYKVNHAQVLLGAAGHNPGDLAHGEALALGVVLEDPKDS